MNFNLLSESFIYNSSSSGVRLVTPEEFDSWIVGTGVAFTFSGTPINILIDLGTQKSIDRLLYTFFPPSLSGLTIKYGRLLDDLIEDTPTLVGSGVEIEPIISGYSYPRYFTILHSGNSEISASGLFVYNTEEDIDFGVSGTLQSITISPPSSLEGYSEVTELLVKNNGNIKTDIYVSTDIYNTSETLIERLELSLTPTGTFYSFENTLSIPEQIPWEWGLFEKTRIIDSKLKLEDPALTVPTLSIGNIYSVGVVTAVGGENWRECIDYTGNNTAIINDQTNRIVFIDPIRSIKTVSAAPVTPASTTNEYNGHSLAWDGNDRIYYMNNSTDQTVRYYKISTNTHHVLTTVSFYTRATRYITYKDGFLYIIGGSAVAGTASTVGSLNYKVEVDTLAETALDPIPNLLSAPSSLFTELNGYIYFITGGGTFSRYNISMNMWDTLISLPINIRLLTSNRKTGLLVFVDSSKNVYTFNPILGTYNLEYTINSIVGEFRGSVIAEDSLLFLHREDIQTSAYIKVLEQPPPINLTTMVSGTWTSPIIKIEEDNLRHQMLINYISSSGAELKRDSSIGVDNFEIRGSDLSPSADNFYETFEATLDPDIYTTSNLNEGSLVTSSSGYLTFSHDFINTTVTPLNAAFMYFNLPFNTTGNMQYKFWWNPATTRLGSAGSNLSTFSIVPFLDTIGTGIVPDRDFSNLKRTQLNYISIILGNTTDTGGKFTQLKVFDGTTTSSFGINAFSGSFYEVNFSINWNTGNYSLYFNGVLIGNGTIPLVKIANLTSQHAFEFYSTSYQVTAQEQFRHFTVSRVNNIVTSEGTLAVPVHVNDTLYGKSGSLTWYPVTLNSALLPKYKYIQARLTFQSIGGQIVPQIIYIKFPKVLILRDVEPGEERPIYIRYKFPSYSGLSTDLIYLKAWMATDKE